MLVYYQGFLFNTKMTDVNTTSILKTSEFTPFKLLEIETVSHDTNLYRFEIPGDQSLVLPVTSCIVTRKPVVGEESQIIRPYTPVSDENVKGFFDLIIKLYPGSGLTSFISTMKPGDFLDMKGPFLKYPYEENTFEEIGLIAGGTGITPMLQLIRKVFKNTSDKTKISLIFANRSEDDILLRNELDGYTKSHPEQFKVYYLLETPPTNWEGGVGYITKEILESHLPKKDSMIFVCGPNPMVQIISGLKSSPQVQGELSGMLLELGYTNERVFKF